MESLVSLLLLLWVALAKDPSILTVYFRDARQEPEQLTSLLPGSTYLGKRAIWHAVQWSSPSVVDEAVIKDTLRLDSVFACTLNDEKTVYAASVAPPEKVAFRGFDAKVIKQQQN